MTPARDAVARRRASFLRAFGMLATTLAAALSLVQAANLRWDLALVNAAAAVTCAVVPLLVILGRTSLAAGWMVLVTWAATTFGVLEGGLAGPTVGYVALIPVAGSLAGGARLGAVTLFLGLATIAGLAAVVPWESHATSEVGTSLTGGLLVALVAAASLVFAGLTDRLTQSLEESRLAARASDLAKSRLLANCSHDLRTPLNAVLGYTDLLREEALDEKRPEEVADLERVENAARQLLGRVDRVLQLARIEAGKVNVQPRPVRLVEVLPDSAGTLPDDATAHVDPVILHEVVDALDESVDADKGAASVLARLTEDGWLRIEAVARTPQAPVAIIADAVAVRLAAHLGGRSGQRPGERWVELPLG